MISNMGKHQRLIVFGVGQQWYAIAIEAVKEITPMALLSRPPGAPNMLAGILNLAGQAVPVVSLVRLFGGKDQSVGAYTPLLILRAQPRRIALQVQRVHEILSVDIDEILPMPEGHSFNDCACGVVNRDGVFVVVLSPERLLLEEEHALLEEFESRQQGRVASLQEATP